MDTSKPILSLILPKVGTIADVSRTLKSLSAQLDRIQLIAFDALPKGFSSSKVVILEGESPGNLYELIDLSLRHIEGEFVAVLPPGLEISPKLTGYLSYWGREYASVDHFYGNYLHRDQAGEASLVEVNPCPDDITEREDWGPLEFYRTRALRGEGIFDFSLSYRPDYDLRLKLTLAHPSRRLPEALCTAPHRESDGGSLGEALFFPGRGRYGGFSYLFMGSKEEREVEAIFYHFLKAKGAYLEHSPSGVFSPAEETSPRVSVVIPVHNRAKFLPLAVKSVQDGIWQDYEIIIVDNASQDDTLAVAQGLAGQDSRIRVISLPDNVIAKALNVGVERSAGQYIAQLDSDDAYTLETLVVMVKALDEHLNWALAISYYDLMDESGQILEEFGVIKHSEYNRNNILRVDGAGALRCWRKEAIVQLGGFNEEDFGHYGEDYDLVLKAGERWEVGRVHQVLYHYRRHPGNSDVLRSAEMKIRNKTLARQRALRRRQIIKGAS